MPSSLEKLTRESSDNGNSLLRRETSEFCDKHIRRKEARVRVESEGSVCFIKNGEHVETRYDSNHPCHGKIAYHEDGSHVRTEYEHWPRMDGSVTLFDNGVACKTTFLEPHV